MLALGTTAKAARRSWGRAGEVHQLQWTQTLRHVHGEQLGHRREFVTAQKNPQDNHSQTFSQVDYIIINSKWKNALSDVKATRGADVGSDHQLLMTTLAVKLGLKRWKNEEWYSMEHGTRLQKGKR